MDFMTDLSLLVYWEGDSYNAILVIVDILMKTVYYKVVKTTIDVSGLAEVIINVVMRHDSLPKLIISNRISLFNSKF